MYIHRSCETVSQVPHTDCTEDCQGNSLSTPGLHVPHDDTFFLANTCINKLLEFKNRPTECTMHKGGSECDKVRKPP